MDKFLKNEFFLGFISLSLIIYLWYATRNPDIVIAALTLINLLFIFYFRNLDRNRFREDERIKRISFWFREIILSRNFALISELNNIILDYEKKVSINLKQDEFGHYRQDLQKVRNEIINNLIDELSLISNELTEELSNLLDDLEDKYTECIENLLNCKSEDSFNFMKGKLQKECLRLTKKFKKTLYDFEMKGYVFKKVN